MSNNLSLSQVTSNQNNKETTINTQSGELDAALTEVLSKDLSAGNVTLTSTEFRRAIEFIGSGHSVTRNLTVPQVKRGLFFARNAGTGVMNVVRGSTSISVAVGKANAFATDGTTNGLVKLTESIDPNAPFDQYFFFPGQPSSSEVLMRAVALRAYSLPASLTGSYARAITASAGSVDYDIQKNGSSIGTITFATSATGSFTFASPVSFAAGDRLEIVAPASPDANLADVSVSLLGTYS